jgi:hypothetical protein
MDLVSLSIIVGVFLGLVTADAAFVSDRVKVRIDVPKQLEESGFGQFTAEELFAAEAQRIGDDNAVLGTEKLAIRSRPGILAALGKPLNLDSLVVAMQNQIGLDVVLINGAVIVDAKTHGLTMPMIISLPRQRTIRFDITQEDGNATALVQRAAERAMEDVAPYRTALRQYQLGQRGQAGAIEHAQAIAERAVSKPWVPSLAEERVTLRNLLALVALSKGDAGAAEKQLQLAADVPQAPVWAPALIAANRAFIDVAAKHPTEARAQLDIVNSYSRGISHWPAISARIETLRGLVAWASGDTTGAEQQFTKAIGELPTDPEPHIYLAQLFDSQGATAKSQQEKAAAVAIGQYDSPLSGLAQTSLWVDPVHGGLTPRYPVSP